MLTATKIDKRFGGHVALDGVDFELRAGEIHGLLGENGAGKSTLMKIFAGAYRPDGGALALDSKPIILRDPKHARDAGIRIVYQELSLIPDLTVAENLFLHRFSNGGIAPISRKALCAEAERLLAQWDIDLPPDAIVGRLPIGRRQLVEIAREIGNEGKVLILDEPTSSLTTPEIEQLFTLLGRLKRSGVGMIFISHRLDEIVRIVDRVTVLRNGLRVGVAEMSKLTTKELVRMIVGRSVENLYPKTDAAMGEVVLEAENLSGPGFSNVSFQLRAGEILGIAGLIGAGRSELLRGIYGLNRISSGTLTFGDQKLRVQRPEQAIASGLILLPEGRNDEGVFPDRSVSDNVIIASLSELTSLTGRLMRRRIRERTTKAVSDFGIATRNPFAQLVKQLSGGNQQKAIFARLLETAPRVMLLDEPTRGVDVGTKTEIHKIMGRFVSKGRAIIVASSELPELTGVCDRIIVLRKGEVAGRFDREQFDEGELLRCAMGLNH